MPKMKTKRAARQAAEEDGHGKLKRAGGWKQHKLESKSPKRAPGSARQDGGQGRRGAAQGLVPYL